REERQANVLDGGAPWYDNYRTRDGKYMSIGPVEGRFYAELLDKLDLAGKDLPAQYDRNGWPALREQFEAVFLTRTRDEWCAVFE
ncbi:CoA transferase, partial [Pseudomonas sp. GW460-13]|uniref:CoA transferase n=1 Tax=Pseudomonas sp. GW460-13 TaxID=2070590 RepID=UPI000CA991D9